VASWFTGLDPPTGSSQSACATAGSETTATAATGRRRARARREGRLTEGVLCWVATSWR
jgi:hypothetical protein